MGDRTYVLLTVPMAHRDFVRSVYDNMEDSVDKYPNDELCYFEFDEVNYGELEHLDRLLAQGVAFDSQWEAGNEYGPGTRYVRFTETGEVIGKEIYDAYGRVSLITLEQLHKNNPAPIDLQREFTNLIQKRRREITIPPWDNQVEYGKRYRAQQLLNQT